MKFTEVLFEDVHKNESILNFVVVVVFENYNTNIVCMVYAWKDRQKMSLSISLSQTIYSLSPIFTFDVI